MHTQPFENTSSQTTHRHTIWMPHRTDKPHGGRLVWEIKREYKFCFENASFATVKRREENSLGSVNRSFHHNRPFEQVDIVFQTDRNAFRRIQRQLYPLRCRSLVYLETGAATERP